MSVRPLDDDTLRPPQDAASEREVLGLCMISPDVIPQVVARLTPGDFIRRSHADVFRAISALDRKKIPVDGATIRAELEDMGVWEAIGTTVLSPMLDVVGLSMYIGTYVDRVAEQAERRRLIEAASDIERLARDTVRSLEQVRSDSESALSKAVGSGESDGVKDQTSGLDALQLVMERGDANDGGIAQVVSGIAGLDKHTGGLDSPWVVTIAAQPGMGKSSLALGYALWSSVAGVRVLVASAEMPEAQVTGRLVSGLSGVPYNIMRRGMSRMQQVERDRVSAAIEEVQGLPIVCDDSSAMTPEIIRARALRYARQYKDSGGLGLVVVDYLQRLRLPGRESKAERIEQAMCSFADLAKELDCPVIVCAQIDKDALKRRARPGLADIKGSSGPVDASDLILFPYRPSVHAGEPPQGRPGSYGAVTASAADGPRIPAARASIGIGKFRHGPIGEIGDGDVRWNGARMLFEHNEGGW